MSRMVYTGFTDMWPSRLRMRSTQMRTVHRVVPGIATLPLQSIAGNSVCGGCSSHGFVEVLAPVFTRDVCRCVGI
ncbi:hypothetical protein ACQJBY_038625 [Aegilops geniculata]